MPVVRLVGLVLALLILLGACNKTYQNEVAERELNAMRTFLEAQKLPVWEVDGLLYAPVVVGDSLAPQEGDVLDFRYTAFAMISGSATMVATNIIADARRGSLPLPVDSLVTERYVVGKKRLFKGLARGLELFAHGGGTGWLGIPSSQLMGARSLGPIPPNTPMCYYIEVVETTASPVE